MVDLWGCSVQSEDTEGVMSLSTVREVQIFQGNFRESSRNFTPVRSIIGKGSPVSHNLHLQK